MLKKLKNQKGFTLIEMLIVLMIISVLIILLVPNLAEKSKDVNEKGCDALKSVVQSQTDAYILEEGSDPSIENLLSENYIENGQTACPNGKELEIIGGKVGIK